jgi:hypothetical protein
MRRRIIPTVERGAIRTRHQMSVRVDRDLNRRVSECRDVWLAAFAGPAVARRPRASCVRVA